MNDFNTMQHLFATNMHSVMTNKTNQQPQPAMNSQISNSPLDFNTMQNLFATSSAMNFQQSSFQPPSQSQSPASVHLSSINQSQNKQVDINDFNTMQNLFQTTNFGANNNSQVERK